ncbi:MAG: Asp-tRNA(Asn) amidotransferase subunit GatC [Methanosphaera sp.]|uniref:Asp-tRNA(Asn) amidotransferase subunit GatC n=1 Tax=Methanosphaera sp. TaxID=2666342 RepID=UPI0025F4E743|nr:Asp-tRNA(Asn) amidotransferase subunit GatC [Methanosphaera sp.]MCI5867076.1 Asp-tRNA(Asn) amidotransferase subunit GatC [Methanosphaera sp.]MDD6535218.1 Asp-tRNA(Asn) amidotransferase subunit GatC [Methanosphaera sp.]MDY3956538.1 Asp-tRNA(Asn) amidotransferase subunit GatC [Methanosphaera sp.]
MEINQEAENILKKFSEELDQIPDLEETQYLVDNLNRMREDKSSNSDYEKILRNARVDKNGSIVSEKGKWTK